MITAVLFFLLGKSFCQTTKPNIIITIGNGVGWGDIGVNNPSNTFTPNVDKLASSGISYLDYHIGGNTASASMAALLTGRHGQRNGVRKDFTPFSVGGLPGGEKTIADYMKGIGYATGYIGVWDLGHQSDFLPLSRGFDYFYGTPFDPSKGCVYMNDLHVPTDSNLNLTCAPERMPVPLMENHTILEQPLNMENLSDEILYAKASDFINNALKQRKPFLLIISVTTIYLPLFSAKEKMPKKDSLLTKLDNTVAMSQNLLQKYGLTHITMSIFTSKTGPEDANCGLSGDVGPYRGGWQRLYYPDSSPTMGSNWEGATRVPFVINWPHGISAFHKNNRLTSAVDLVKTLADVIGFNLHADRIFDGISMKSDWRSEKSDKNESRILYFLEYDTDTVLVFRINELKVYFRTSGARKCNSTHDPTEDYVHHLDHPLVFDLISDKGELHNLTYNSSLASSLHEYKKNGDSMFLYDRGLKSIADYLESESAVLCCNARCDCTMHWRDIEENQVRVDPDAYIDEIVIPIYGVIFICFIVLMSTVFVLYKSYIVYANKKYGFEPVLDRTEMWRLLVRKT